MKRVVKFLFNVYSYIQGNIIYKCINSKNWKWLIPKYIQEQYEYRVNTMNKQCYDQGSCIACGCETTQLQAAYRACENDCYPYMLTYKEWKQLKQKRHILKLSYNNTEIIWGINTDLKKFYKLVINNNITTNKPIKVK